MIVREEGKEMWQAGGAEGQKIAVISGKDWHIFPVLCAPFIYLIWGFFFNVTFRITAGITIYTGFSFEKTMTCDGGEKEHGDIINALYTYTSSKYCIEGK